MLRRTTSLAAFHAPTGGSDQPRKSDRDDAYGDVLEAASSDGGAAAQALWVNASADSPSRKVRIGVLHGAKDTRGNLVFPCRAVCDAKTDRSLTCELHLCNVGKIGTALRQT